MDKSFYELKYNETSEEITYSVKDSFEGKRCGCDASFVKALPSQGETAAYIKNSENIVFSDGVFQEEIANPESRGFTYSLASSVNSARILPVSSMKLDQYPWFVGDNNDKSLALLDATEATLTKDRACAAFSLFNTKIVYWPINPAENPNIEITILKIKRNLKNIKTLYKKYEDIYN